MTVIYDAMIIQHRGNPNPNIVLFYDTEKTEVLKFIRNYVSRNGFTYISRGGKQFTCATVALRKRESTSKVISLKPYHELFNTLTGEILKEKGESE